MKLLLIFLPLIIALTVQAVMLLRIDPAMIEKPYLRAKAAGLVDRVRQEHGPYVLTFGSSVQDVGNLDAPFPVRLEEALARRGEHHEVLGTILHGASSWLYYEYLRAVVEPAVDPLSGPSRQTVAELPAWVVLEINPRSFSNFYARGLWLDIEGWKKRFGVYSGAPIGSVIELGVADSWVGPLLRPGPLHSTLSVLSVTISAEFDRLLAERWPSPYDQEPWRALVNRSPMVNTIGTAGPVMSPSYAGNFSKAWIADWRKTVDLLKSHQTRVLLYVTPINPQFDNPEATPEYRSRVLRNLNWLSAEMTELRPNVFLDLSLFLDRDDFMALDPQNPMARDPFEHLDPRGMRKVTERIAEEMAAYR